VKVDNLTSRIDDFDAVEAWTTNDVQRDALGVSESVRMVPVCPGTVFVLVA
jgi:hypothetical protein